jgi:hypothetical protein
MAFLRIHSVFISIPPDFIFVLSRTIMSTDSQTPLVESDDVFRASEEKKQPPATSIVVTKESTGGDDDLCITSRTTIETIGGQSGIENESQLVSIQSVKRPKLINGMKPPPPPLGLLKMPKPPPPPPPRFTATSECTQIAYGSVRNQIAGDITADTVIL